MQENNEHIVSGYDDELSALMSDIYQLGEHVYSMTSDAIKAMKKRDSDMAHDVIERDQQANFLQDKIDGTSLKILALRHPMATDLRRVVAATRLATDFERIGDLAEGIAKPTLDVNDEEQVELAKSVSRMGKSVKQNFKACLEALHKEDASLAVEVWAEDEDINDLYSSLFRELVAVMVSNPRKISACTSLLFMAKNLERIGDHISNVCEAIYFTQTAKQLINDPALEEVRARDRD